MNIENTHELQHYLKTKGIISTCTELKSELLTGGVSNRTVKINFNGNSWVMKQALPKLRVTGDWYSAPERIYYESDAIRWLDRNMSGSCPKLTFEDKAHYIMAMEAVPPPFHNLKDLLISSTPLSEYFIKAGKLLGQIHNIGCVRDNIPELFFDTQFFESLRINPYYGECQKQIIQTKDFFEQLITDTRSNCYTFTHGDYSPKNLLLKNNQLILLDHEVAHFGDGTFDLGFFMAHLLSKANHRLQYRNIFLQGIADFFMGYQKSSGTMDRVKEKRAVRHAIGCLLARVKGLSRLEYLTNREKEAQLAVALRLIASPPLTISQLVKRFSGLIDAETDKIT